MTSPLHESSPERSSSREKHSRPHFWSLFTEPLEPSEPSYQVVAQAALAIQTMEYEDPLYETVYEYWKESIKEARKTEHSVAVNAEEYIALVNHVAPVIQGKRPSYSELKQKMDIVEFVERHADRMIHAAGKFRTQCILPDHAERTPSFWVYPATQSYYCFGCHQGGDLIDLIKKMGLDPYEVIR